jgi:CubicO group peptidase (beta-lactamase class C family)
VPYHDLVDERVVRPARLADTGFLRSDALPPGTAAGYLFSGEDLRTNVLHLPLRGVGDGGIHTTVADVHALWTALDAGRIVGPETLALMTRLHSVVDIDEPYRRYGLGFWLERAGDGVVLEGYDAGVSFRSQHRVASGLTWTVVSNWSDGAWPVARAIAAAFPLA